MVERGTPGSASSFAQCLRRRSYAVIDLPRPAACAVAQLLLLEAPNFFRDTGATAGLEAPPENADGTPSYRGYFSTVARQVLFARLTHSGGTSPQPPQPHLPSLAAASLALHELGVSLLQQLAVELSLPAEFFTGSLSTRTTGTEGSGQSSLISLFSYTGVEGEVPCPEHVDYTLLTIAPFATEAGLEVLDLERFEWMLPEEGQRCAPRAIVMAGEALEYMTKGAISATTHRVAHAFGSRRYSCPYLLYPDPHAPLHRRRISSPGGCGGAGAGEADAEEEVFLAGDVMRASQLSKDSAVYGSSNTRLNAKQSSLAVPAS